MQKPGIEPRPVNVEFVLDIRTARQCFSEYFFCPRQHHPTNTPHIHSSITNAISKITASWSTKFSLVLVWYRPRAHLPSPPHPIFKGEDVPSVPKLIFLAYISHSPSGREFCVENSDSMQILNVSWRRLWRFQRFADPVFKCGPDNGFYHTYLNNFTYIFRWLREHSYLLCY